MLRVQLIEAGDEPVLETEPYDSPGLPLLFADLEPLDVEVAHGRVPRPLPLVPGSTAVVDTEDGPRFVLPSHPGGTFADHIDVAPELLVPLPPGLDSAKAALGGPVAVAWLALFDRAGTEPGETVLVVGATGLVGGAATQLAARRGAVVIGAARDPQAVPRVEGAIAIGLGDLAAQVGEMTGGRGADVVVDLLGGPFLDDVIRTGGPGCRHVLVGTAAGAVTQVVLPRLLASEHRLLGFRRTATPHPRLVRAHEEALAVLADGALAVPDVPRFRLEDVAAAYRQAAGGGHVLLVGAHVELPAKAPSSHSSG